MLYAFELSGEHDELPRKEILSSLRLAGFGFKEHARLDQCLVVDIEGHIPDIDMRLTAVAERLAMSHHIVRVAGMCDVMTGDIISLAEDCDISEHIVSGSTYLVRSKRIKHYGNEVKREEIESRIGGIIYRKGYRANLRSPDVEFRLIITDRAVFGSVVASVDRSTYEQRAPHKKPFFYPGVLMPRVARALVNISEVKPGEVLLDPFSGTAGILVEAGMLSVHVIGLEVRQMIAHGARMNLEMFGADHSLLVGDACRVPLKDLQCGCDRNRSTLRPLGSHQGRVAAPPVPGLILRDVQSTEKRQACSRSIGDTCAGVCYRCRLFGCGRIHTESSQEPYKDFHGPAQGLIAFT